MIPPDLSRAAALGLGVFLYGMMIMLISAALRLRVFAAKRWERQIINAGLALACIALAGLSGGLIKFALGG